MQWVDICYSCIHFLVALNVFIELHGEKKFYSGKFQTEQAVLVFWTPQNSIEGLNLHWVYYTSTTLNAMLNS